MTAYYIVFERSDDPRQEKAISVQEELWEAEEVQLATQQDRATAYNRGRDKAFHEGRAFTERKTAADYSFRFRIEKVTS